MDDRIEEILSQLKNISLPANLNSRILASVRRERRKRLAMARFLYAALLATLSALGVSVRLLVSELSDSPLIALIQLALSDSREVLGAFGFWVLAIVESLPIGSLTAALGGMYLAAVLLARIIALSAKNHQAKEA